MASSSANIDLYEVLGIQKSASRAEIKKAYHKAALSSHPDKVPEHEREEAHIKFKAVSEAYEILYDEEKRSVYDVHGMAAFDGSRPGGMGPEVDLDDILQQMFGMGGGMGGMGGMGGDPFGGGGPKRPRRGRNEEQEYKVTLEELYKGKTVKFGATKNVICGVCKGSGGKDKIKPKTCERCHGNGFNMGLRQVGPGLVTQERVMCDACQGTGEIFKEKDRCKKCKGKRTTMEKKALELYIPRGAMQGERIVLEGEADQVPGQIPGDIIFTLVEEDHDVFQRAGSDLLAELRVTLAEALCGFTKVILHHLDGRGIQLTHPRGKVLTPGQTLKIAGEGMPRKKSDSRGDLYLTVQIDFPEDGWMEDEAAFARLAQVLPASQAAPLDATNAEEVEYTREEDLKGFGAHSGDPRAGDGWEDDEGMEGGTQCATQ